MPLRKQNIPHKNTGKGENMSIENLLLIGSVGFIVWFFRFLLGVAFGKSSAKTQFIDYLTLDKELYKKKIWKEG